jgi:hypothetical protein
MGQISRIFFRRNYLQNMAATVATLSGPKQQLFLALLLRAGRASPASLRDEGSHSPASCKGMLRSANRDYT